MKKNAFQFLCMVAGGASLALGISYLLNKVGY